MSHVFPRHTKTSLPTATRGDGCYLIDAEGKRYLDCGDAAVSCLGHSDQAVIKAVQDQVAKVAFAHNGFMTSEPAEALANLLIANAPGDLDRVYFVSGGSEATESAIKLARQYYLEIGQPERRHVIARKQSYHGNTLGALSASGNEWRRAQFAPLLVEMSHIAACYEYTGRQDDESGFDYGQRVANELEAEILRVGPKAVMAFMAEPVVGATLGAVPAVEGYFKRIREICDTMAFCLFLMRSCVAWGAPGTCSPVTTTVWPRTSYVSPRGWVPVISRLARCFALTRFTPPSRTDQAFSSTGIPILATLWPLRLRLPLFAH